MITCGIPSMGIPFRHPDAEVAAIVLERVERTEADAVDGRRGHERAEECQPLRFLELRRAQTAREAASLLVESHRLGAGWTAKLLQASREATLALLGCGEQT